MTKRYWKAGVSLIAALVLVAATIFCGAPGALGQDSGDLSKWSESSSRKAGTRQTLKVGKVEIGLVWVPAGEFEMGSPESEKGRGADEKLHHVKLTRGFWMLETETTQALYKEVVGTNPSEIEGDDLPVENVSYEDAIKFCQALSGLLPAGLNAALPTEAEWEYACRAGSTTPFSFGVALNGDKANCDGTDPYGMDKEGTFVGKTTPVKSYEPNAFGLYDMHGNVWERVFDLYGSYSSDATDPTGPRGGSTRVCRGGSWFSYAHACRSACRREFASDEQVQDVGFRFIVRLEEVLASADSWAESSSRKAGTRQTLKVGEAEYGFVWIPKGDFDMGYSEHQHRVKLTKGFWMLETETTQALYKAIMSENPSSSNGDNLPVENVSWDDAMKFCAELTKRLPKGLKASLPTEAQWEYACRAGTKTAYWYGNSADSSKMNYDSSETKTVKSYAPNPWGLYDMHGNVWEWTSDYYGDYPTGIAVDPKGPNSASNRVFRGGSWRIYGGDCRSAIRFWGSSDRRSSNLGFRVLLSCD